MFRPEIPFNDLPKIPPAQELETKAVLKAVTDASRQLAELKGQVHTLPNADILLSKIALEESKASSEVENIFTTHDELYQALNAGEDKLPPEKREVLRYREALFVGEQEIRGRPVLTTDLFIRLVNVIKGNTAGIRSVPGTRLKNPATGQIVYTPPEGAEVIHGLLGNLLSFATLDDDGLDPLVKMAVIHYQFEAIHPFHDGNGRTGRIILILYLVLKGLLDRPVLFLSRYIVRNKADYYLHLRGVTERGEWEPWIMYLIRAVELTSKETRQKIEAMRDLLKEMTEEAQRQLPARNFRKEVVEFLFKELYCRIDRLAAAGIPGIANRVTATKVLKQMAAIGLVEQRKEGRDLLFVNTRLRAILESNDPE